MCAPLNREVLERNRNEGGEGGEGGGDVTAGEKRVLVVVNPMSGNKKGRALWEQVEVLLRYLFCTER
jgi:hypothetical protein